MYYVLHRPRGSTLPYLEISFRSGKEAKAAVRTLHEQKKPDGTLLCEVKLCIGKGRNRRDILRL